MSTNARCAKPRTTNTCGPGELQDNGHQVFDFGYACERPPQGRLVSMADIEAKIWLEQLPREILRHVRESSRLEGNQRDASDAVAQLILRREPISRRALIETFHIASEKVTFVIVRVSTLADGDALTVFEGRGQVGGLFPISVSRHG